MRYGTQDNVDTGKWKYMGRNAVGKIYKRRKHLTKPQEYEILQPSKESEVSAPNN